MSAPDVHCIKAFSLEGRWVVLADGEVLPLTNMLDGDGEETDDPELCTTFVCGPCQHGNWIADAVSNYEPAKRD